MNRNLIHQLQRLPIIFNEYCFSNQGLDLDSLGPGWTPCTWCIYRNTLAAALTCSARKLTKALTSAEQCKIKNGVWTETATSPQVPRLSPSTWPLFNLKLLGSAGDVMLRWSPPPNFFFFLSYRWQHTHHRPWGLPSRTRLGSVPQMWTQTTGRMDEQAFCFDRAAGTEVTVPGKMCCLIFMEPQTENTALSLKDLCVCDMCVTTHLTHLKAQQHRSNM